MYKKSERLAKAIHLIAPALRSTTALHDRLSAIAMALVDAAIEPPHTAREALSRELLALSSVLAIARTSGTLSPMNADLISREAQNLLQEVAAYEEPRVTLDALPSIAALERTHAATTPREPVRTSTDTLSAKAAEDGSRGKGHTKDRREAVMTVIRTKGQVGIKEISRLIREVSEKTIQRELVALVEEGLVRKQGERRWSVYSLV